MTDHGSSLTIVVSYPERGRGGNSRYRGNCSPKLIEDLIDHFKPMEICDYMCGSTMSLAIFGICPVPLGVTLLPTHRRPQAGAGTALVEGKSPTNIADQSTDL